MTTPTENPNTSAQDDIRIVLQETLIEQATTILNFTRTEGFALQIPETDTLILVGRASKISEFLYLAAPTVLTPYASINGESCYRAVEVDAYPAALASQSQAAQPTDSREVFEAQARQAGHTNFMRMAGDPDAYDDLVLRAEYRGWCAAHIAGTSQAQPTDKPSLLKNFAPDEQPLWDDNGEPLNEAAEASDRAAFLARTSQATKAQAEPTIPAHLSEFVQAVAHDFTAYDEGDDEHYCRGCSALIVNEAPGTRHQDDCIVPRAKAALAAPVAKEAPAVLEDWNPLPTPEGSAFYAYHPSLVHADFNPWGVVEAVHNGEEVVGAVWNGCQDCWDTVPIEVELWKSISGPVASVAKEATRDAETTEKANVLPARRFASIRGFFDADYVEFAAGCTYGGGVLDGVPHDSKNYTRSEAEGFVRDGAWREITVPPAAEQSNIAGSAREGGITNPESGSDLATTTSTVSAPTDENIELVKSGLREILAASRTPDRAQIHALAFESLSVLDGTEGAQKAPEEVREDEEAVDQVISEAEDAHEPAESVGAYRCREAIRALRTSSIDQANADTGSAA